MIHNLHKRVLGGVLVGAMMFTMMGFAKTSQAERAPEQVAAEPPTEIPVEEGIITLADAGRREELRTQIQAQKALEEQKAAEEARRAEEERQAALEKQNAEDRELLAALIFCEAGGEPYEGQVAVGAVVMNRIKCSVYPNDLRSVIYQSGQFGPAMTGKLANVLAGGQVTDSCRQAAKEAMAGKSPVGDCLYFGDGGSGMRIGNHQFH